jgi:hypothetical protein
MTTISRGEWSRAGLGGGDVTFVGRWGDLYLQQPVTLPLPYRALSVCRSLSLSLSISLCLSPSRALVLLACARARALSVLLPHYWHSYLHVIRGLKLRARIPASKCHVTRRLESAVNKEGTGWRVCCLYCSLEYCLSELDMPTGWRVYCLYCLLEYCLSELDMLTGWRVYCLYCLLEYCLLEINMLRGRRVDVKSAMLNL